MSFKHFYQEIILNEGKWWSKFKEDQVFTLEANGKKYRGCKMEERPGDPAYVLESRAGARYGLFRVSEGKFMVVRMKSGKKHMIKPRGGCFKETDGKLIFELEVPIQGDTIQEKNANVEPDKSFPNGEPTYDLVRHETQKGIHTSVKI